MQAIRLQVPYRTNTTKAGEESSRKRVERVAGYFFLDIALTCGRMEAEEVLHGGKLRGHGFPKDALPYSGFVRDRKSLLEGNLLHLSIVPAKIPCQH